MNGLTATLYPEHDKLAGKLDSLIDNLNTSKHNIKEIKRFYEYYKAERPSNARLLKLFYVFKVLLKYIDFDFSRNNKDEQIIAVWNKIISNGYSESYEEDFYELIKKFYKLVYKKEIPLKFKKKVHLQEKREPLTFEEICKLISTATNSRDKCIVALAFESCCRPSEYLLLKYGDIKETDGGLTFQVEGKTGVRRIFLFQFVNYISQWLDDHPSKKPDDRLFVNIHKKKVEPISLAGANKVLRLLMARAEIAKPNHLYWLRHSGATYARGVLHLSDRTLEEKMGWTRGSRQASVYDHSTGEQTKEDILKALGIIPKEKIIPKGSQICWRCKEPNGVAQKYCIRCGNNLNSEKLINEHKLFKVVLSILNNKKVGEIVKTEHGIDLKELFENETSKAE